MRRVYEILRFDPNIEQEELQILLNNTQTDLADRFWVESRAVLLVSVWHSSHQVYLQAVFAIDVP